MKIKISWGTGILITFILFMISVLTQVFFYMNTDVDLVTDDYYEKGSAYEEQISHIQNSETLADSLSIKYEREELEITFPRGYSYDKIEGTLLFYRPSDSSMDFTVKIKADNNWVQKISTRNIASGFWKLKMNWRSGDDLFYYEKSLLVN